MSEVEVIVIGGGIAGVSVGYELAKSKRTVVLERESRGDFHATGRNAACFAQNYGPPIVRRLTAASRSFMEQPPSDFAGAALLSPRGILTLAPKAQRDTLDQALAVASELGSPMERIGMDEASRLLPPLRGGFAETAAFDRLNQDIDVSLLYQSYLQGYLKRGGAFHTSVEIGTIEAHGKGWRVRTAEGTLEAPVLVNAAGAWGDQVAALAGVPPVGLVAYRRTAFTFSAADWREEHASWPMFKDADETFYCKPFERGYFASPAEAIPEPPGDAQATQADVDATISRIQEAADLPVNEVTRYWAGLRTFSPDKAPVVGSDPDAPGFFWLVGQGGYGIKTAPALAKITSALIQKGEWPALASQHGLAEQELSVTRLRS